MTAAFADGSSLCALRVSTDARPPTLFYAEGGEVEVGDGEVRMRPGRGSILVMSEPLDAHDEAWREVPPGHVLETRGGVARVSALAAP
jgi:predicted glutamine amidotransferase